MLYFPGKPGKLWPAEQPGCQGEAARWHPLVPAPGPRWSQATSQLPPVPPALASPSQPQQGWDCLGGEIKISALPSPREVPNEILAGLKALLSSFKEVAGRK